MHIFGHELLGTNPNCGRSVSLIIGESIDSIQAASPEWDMLLPWAIGRFGLCDSMIT